MASFRVILPIAFLLALSLTLPCAGELKPLSHQELKLSGGMPGSVIVSTSETNNTQSSDSKAVRQKHKAPKLRNSSHNTNFISGSDITSRGSGDPKIQIELAQHPYENPELPPGFESGVINEPKNQNRFPVNQVQIDIIDGVDYSKLVLSQDVIVGAELVDNATPLESAKIGVNITTAGSPATFPTHEIITIDQSLSMPKVQPMQYVPISMPNNPSIPTISGASIEISPPNMAP